MNNNYYYYYYNINNGNDLMGIAACNIKTDKKYSYNII